MSSLNNLPVPADPTDPSAYGWPPGLHLQPALYRGQGKTKEICESYGLSQSDFAVLKTNPYFIQALTDAVEEMSKDGASFRRKARVQAEEYLKTSWKLVHSSNEDVPPRVKADLIMWTQRIAGYDASLDQKAQANAQAVAQNALQIVINLGDDK